MILPLPSDAIHKAWLYRVLTAISDNSKLSSVLAFKGGTAAAMLGYLDRFSIDLDFDYLGSIEDLGDFKIEIEKLFLKLNLTIRDQSENVPQYFLKYPISVRQHGVRNTFKIDITFPPPLSNQYNFMQFKEIDRIIRCQTIETMFANKLVAILDRFEKNNSIAGRDIYDIHHYFINGCRFNKDVILERRRGISLQQFFDELYSFIKSNITPTILNQDLNTLLSPEKFKTLRWVIKDEVLMMIRDIDISDSGRG